MIRRVFSWAAMVGSRMCVRVCRDVRLTRLQESARVRSTSQTITKDTYTRLHWGTRPRRQFCEAATCLTKEQRKAIHWRSILSSERVHRAKWVLDGVRGGKSLGALLGYRFGRGLCIGEIGRFN